jgi:cell division protein FtsB
MENEFDHTALKKQMMKLQEDNLALKKEMKDLKTNFS